MTKSAIVTGCSQGIGMAISQRFEHEGYRVFGIDLNEGDFTCASGSCDLDDLEKTEEVFEKLFREHGTPDVLVNNAGIYFGMSWDQETIDQYQKTMDTNSRAVFFTTKLFARRLIKEKCPGSIVNVSSISAQIGSVDPAYAASKAAVDALTKSFARALAPHGIRVNAVAPGPINTALAARIPEDRKKEYVKMVLQKRFGEPSEIASMVYFLAGDEASFITGEIVNVNGGIL